MLIQPTIVKYDDPWISHDRSSYTINQQFLKQHASTMHNNLHSYTHSELLKRNEKDTTHCYTANSHMTATCGNILSCLGKAICKDHSFKNMLIIKL